MSVKVSIVVPVYNVEQYLSRCMDSLLNQTLKDIEIILVDDESPDSCPYLCDQYAMTDSRVKVIHKKNGGLGLARNTGLDAAIGEFVAFCDSDDCVDLNTYEYCFSLAKKENVEIVRFKEDRFTETFIARTNDLDNANPIICRDTKILKQIAIEFWGYPVVDKPTIRGVSAASSCMGLYSRSLLIENNIRFKSEREYLSEDFEFNYNVLQHAHAVCFTENVFYHYFINLKSLSRTAQPNKTDRAITFSKLMSLEMKRDGYDEIEYTLHPMYYAFSILRDVQKLVFLSDMTLKEKRVWFYEQKKKSYYRECIKKYPLNRIPFKFSLSFMLTMGGFFWLSLLLVKLKGR